MENRKEQERAELHRTIWNIAATFAKSATVQNEGTRQVERQIEYYNLDVIISMGYRVKSLRGILFRQRATKQSLRKKIPEMNRMSKMEELIAELCSNLPAGRQEVGP